MKKSGVIKILTSLKDGVKRQYRAEIRGIFGSYVTGRAKKTSDIDILVNFDAEADMFDLIDLSSFLEKKLKRKVDIVPQDALRKEIRESVLREAIYL